MTIDSERFSFPQNYVPGCLEKDTDLPYEHLPIWGGPPSAAVVEPCPTIPRDQWATTQSARPDEWDDIDQNGYPACTLAATCNAMELLLAKRGRALTKLDWLKAWRVLSGGAGGVEIGRALRYAMDVGIPLLDGSGVLKITEAWDIGSVDALGTGLQADCIGVFGHDAHAECAAGLIVDGSTVDIDTRNSWGDKGRWHRYSLARVALKQYGAYLIRDLELRDIDIPK